MAKQRLCYTMTKVPDHYVSLVNVPEATVLYPGQLIVADSIDAAIDGNFSVRVPSAPTADNIKKEIVGIVTNGTFETLQDGRRPDGQPDFTQYEFTAGETATIVWALPKVIVYMSDDCVIAGGDVNEKSFITPTAGNMDATGTATEPADGAVKSYLKILCKKYTRAGGQSGAGFISGSVCECVNQ